MKIRNRWIMMVALFVGAQEFQALAQDLAELYEQGLYLEETKKDLPGAVEAYQSMLDHETAHPALQMQARFRLATCRLKQGDAPAAKEMLQGLIATLPDPDTLQNGEAPTLESLDQNFTHIMNIALEELGKEQLLDAAFEGVVAKLGQHADYFDKDELESFVINMERELVGIGAILKLEEERLIIAGIIPGSPAEETGLAKGDEILAVDGRDIASFNGVLPKIVGAIRGESSTQVKLDVTLVDTGEPHTFTVTRRKLELKGNPPVNALLHRAEDDPVWFMDEENGIAAVSLKQFTHEVAEELQETIDRLREEGLKALVLDLRSNGGGSLDACVKVADLFLQEGLIVSSKSRSNLVKERRAQAEGTYPNFPLAVLVDSHTASASEIVAACLQDHQRAVIIGERTFGKGTVETMMDVVGGGALKLSISTFARPSGQELRRLPDSTKWGVEPNKGFELTSPIRHQREGAKPNSVNRLLAVDKPLAKAIDHLREQLNG